MKTRVKIDSVLFRIFSGLFFFCGGIFAQHPDYIRLADNIVNKTIQIKPGEQVLIYGNKAMIDLMEQLAIKIALAGGHSYMITSSDNVDYNYWHNVPIEFIKNDKKIIWNYVLSNDVVITLPQCVECNHVYGNIPDEKRKLMVNTDEENQRLNQSKVRQYFFQFPQKEWAKNYGFTESDFESMIWKAMETDYSKVSERCKKLNDILMAGKQIKITSPDGTNFSASLSGKRAKLNDGIVSPEEADSKVFIDRFVSLPTGSIYVIPNEKSGNGTIVSLYDSDIDSNPLENVKGVIKNGEIMEMSAKKGNEFISKFYSSLAGNDKQLGGLNIGVNPDLKSGVNPLLFQGEAEGMVYIGFGGNITQGGSNDSKNGWNFPVVNATVEVDGKVIINNGKLTL